MSDTTELKDKVKCRQSGKKKPLAHGWIVLPSKSYPDRVFFYNTVTKSSTWTNPCEGNDNNSSESSSQSSSPSTSFSSQISTGRSSSYSSHKTSGTNDKPNLPVQTREDKQQTGIKDKNVNESKNSDIEDFDDSDQYFESDASSKCIVSSTHSGDVHSLFDSIENPFSENYDEMKSNSATEDKELWWYSSSSRNTCVKKSVALSDIEDTLFCSKDSEMSKDSQKTGRNWYEDGTSSGGGGAVRKNGFKTPESTKESSYKGSKSSRRRSKKSPGPSETQTKSDVPKLSKQQHFKRRDKTPAQTRLLKLREKNAEMLKEYELSEGRDKTPTSSQDSRTRNVNQNLEFKEPSETSIANIDDDANDTIIIDNYMEEMDWEPTSEELDAQNINVLCEQMDTTRESSSDLFSSMSHSVTEVANLSYSWILVLDTNVLVSCLSFIRELRDTGFPGLGYPVIYIPWRVLQELDHLKDSRIEGTYSHLSTNVRKAISYLNENFKSLHPRCVGQSFDDFKEMVDADTVAPDDEILETCLRLQKLHPEKKLTLLTNDKNLESKALVSRIETYSKDEFQKKYFKSGTPSGLRIPTEVKKSSVGAAEIDNFVCELKRILKNFVPFMVETEMKLAFKKDWTKLAFKKPPWTLQDSFDCFLKHWRSVFFAIFPKDVYTETKDLYRKLFRKEPETVEEICEIIHTMQKLLFTIKNSLISPRPYSAELQSTTTKLFKLLQEVMSRSSQVNDQIHSLTSPERMNGFSLGETSRSEGSTNWETGQIKNLLKEIWNSLNNFCFTLSNLTSASDRPNGSLMLETRMKLSQTLNGLHELIFSINKILEIPLRDINESHPVIIHLTNFLIKLLPSIQSQMETDLPKFLVVVCTETEGRLLLHGSLKDFRCFAENLMKANEFFEGGRPSF